MTLARTTAKGLGMPELPVVIVPHPLATRTPEGLDKLVSDAMNDIVAALTQEPRQ
jgi:hypothetical protein